MKMKIFQFFFKTDAPCKIWSQKFWTFLILNFFDFLLKKGILKVYFNLPSGSLYINSRKDSVGIGTFPVKKIGE